MNVHGTDRRCLPRRRKVHKLARKMIWGAVLAAAVTFSVQSLLSEPTSVLAQANGHSAVDDSLVTHAHVLADGTQQLCVLDPRQQVVAIYHIDPAKGGITLRSVRNIYWDLRINHFNGTTPLPEEIRSLIEQE